MMDATTIAKAIEAKGGQYFSDICDSGSGKPRWSCNCPVCCVLGGHNRDPRPHKSSCGCKSCQWANDGGAGNETDVP